MPERGDRKAKATKGVSLVLRRARPWLWGLAAGALAIFLASSFWPTREAEPQVEIGGRFTLTDQTGKRVKSSDYRGKIQLIYFGFTHCPDVCPTSLMIAAAAMKQLGDEAEGVQPIFITLDPERDTPEVMGAYVEAILPGMAGLTGSLEEIAAVASAYKVGFWKVADPNSVLPYTIDHASLFFVMDREGRFVRFYTHGASSDEIAAGLRDALKAN